MGGKVALRFLIAEAGEISASDLDMAYAADAFVVSFNASPSEAIMSSAKQQDYHPQRQCDLSPDGGHHGEDGLPPRPRGCPGGGRRRGGEGSLRVGEGQGGGVLRERREAPEELPGLRLTGRGGRLRGPAVIAAPREGQGG